MTRVIGVALSLALLTGTGCGGVDSTMDEEAATTSEEVQVQGFRYRFQSWDRDGSGKDNPVSIIFVSKHPNMVARVYDQIADVGLTHEGSEMTLSGAGPSRPGVNPTDHWTSHSHGRKGAFGCWGNCGQDTDIHLRTYGPDGHLGTQVYQGSHGVRPYYLIATVHFDVAENTSHEDFGHQDRARKLLVEKLVAKGTWRKLGASSLGNSCHHRIDATHLCDHDGRALIVSIDG